MKRIKVFSILLSRVFSEILLIGTLVLISILYFPFLSYADTWRLFKVTFEGTGTYQYIDSPFEALDVKFSFKTVYDPLTVPPGTVILSEDQASSPDTWGYPIGITGGSSNLTGTFTLTYPDGTCSGSISGEDLAVYVYAFKSILSSSGDYLFYVESVDQMALHGCTDAPIEWGFGYREPRSFFAADFILPPDALAQGKIIQYVNYSYTGPGEYTGSTQSIAWNGTVTFEKLAEYSTPSSPPAPVAGYSFSYDPVDTPIFSFNPATAKPIGLGPAANGGDTLDLSVDFSYPSLVDLYLAIHAPSISQDFFLIGPGPSIQPLSQGIIKWKENITGPVEETVFSNISIGALPASIYYFYLLATPPNSTAAYYLWQTQFTK